MVRAYRSALHRGPGVESDRNGARVARRRGTLAARVPARHGRRHQTLAGPGKGTEGDRMMEKIRVSVDRETEQVLTQLTEAIQAQLDKPLSGVGEAVANAKGEILRQLASMGEAGPVVRHAIEAHVDQRARDLERAIEAVRAGGAEA